MKLNNFGGYTSKHLQQFLTMRWGKKRINADL